MQQLLWKEWHEQRWKLVFGCVLLPAIVLIGLRARLLADQTMIEWVCVGGMLLSILSATGLLPAEREEGSFETLLALPISPRQILIGKTVMGVLLIVGPLSLSAAISCLFFANREITLPAMVLIYLRSILASVSLFVWMFTLTSNLPSETRAGLLSIGVLVLWGLASAGLADESVPWLLSTISPLAFLAGLVDSRHQSVPEFFIVLVVHVIICLLLWTWTARRITAETNVSE